MSRSPVAIALAMIGLILALVPARAETATGNASPLEGLITRASQLRLADERYWHLLLHYRRTFLGGLTSEADGRGFFLSETGKRDSRAEIEATLAAFFEPVPDDPEVQHPQCRFPARYAWLKERLGFETVVPPQLCDRFQTWKSRMDVESITLLFASAYLDNPASMYGHTFLRLNQRRHGGGERLLDYTVNFAARTDTQSGILFAVLGLTGGYQGYFSTAPFYVKVQEYNNLQNRDLWEYTLNLTPEQLDRLIRHLWEMGTTSFDYYFLSENCSYQLLPLLDVADPSLHLADAMRSWVIPVDTVRLLRSRPGLVTEVRHRPSHLTQMLARRSMLRLHEIDAAQAIATGNGDQRFLALEGLPPEREAAVLDSAYEYVRYRHGFTWNQSDEAKRDERALLVRRSRLVGVSSAPLNLPESPALERAHGTSRMGGGVVLHHGKGLVELSLRAALHDLGAIDTGYIPDSQLEMGHLRLRYDLERRKAFVEGLTIIDIVSISPSDRWVRRPSWAVWLGLGQARELRCELENCLYGGLTFGRGISVASQLWSRETYYLLGEGEVSAGGVFHDRYRLGAGVTGGALIQVASPSRLRLDATYRRYPSGENHPLARWSVQHGFTFGSSIEWRVGFERRGSYREITTAVYAYF